MASPLGAAELDRGEWFKSLRQPKTNMSCCDIADCKQVDARPVGAGWAVLIDDKWRKVPVAAVLLKPSIDGEAYACTGLSFNFATQEERDIKPAPLPYIYCFIPPNLGV